jgi:hypothetical protein
MCFDSSIAILENLSVSASVADFDFTPELAMN